MSKQQSLLPDNTNARNMPRNATKKPFRNLAKVLFSHLCKKSKFIYENFQLNKLYHLMISQIFATQNATYGSQEPTDDFPINHALPRPTNDDPNSWCDYWRSLVLPWRTEPEIDAERQLFLKARRVVEPDIQQGIFPFRYPDVDEKNPNIKLNRADVEWLLATHESSGMRGPVDWSDIHQKGRVGLDLRDADLRAVDLRGLPLARLRGGLSGEEWRNATEAQRNIAAIRLGGAIFPFAHLEESILTHADLGGANLREAHLEGADMFRANLVAEEPATLRMAFFDETSKLEETILVGQKRIGVQIVDVHWGNVNLAAVNWDSIRMLQDEYKARNWKKDRKTLYEDIYMETQLNEYITAVRANRQLATVLRNQGINEQADKFAYRAQVLQRHVLWLQRRWLRSFGSLLLDLISGYGYRPLRSFATYIIAVLAFAAIYFALGGPLCHPLTWNEALVVSMTAFHGRGFFASAFQPGDPQAAIASVEALVGLLVEITFISTFTQRFFAR